jgi:hypothetical protein
MSFSPQKSKQTGVAGWLPLRGGMGGGQCCIHFFNGHLLKIKIGYDRLLAR